MSVNDIVTVAINALQSYHRDLVPFAPPLASYPTIIDTPNLPMAICWPVESTFSQKGQGGALKRIDQGIEVLVYTMPLTQNDIPSRAAADVVLLQQFRMLYLDAANVPIVYPTANDPYQITIESSESAPHSDSGLRADLMYGGRPFAGFSLRLRVRALW